MKPTSMTARPMFLFIQDFGERIEIRRERTRQTRPNRIVMMRNPAEAPRGAAKKNQQIVTIAKIRVPIILNHRRRLSVRTSERTNGSCLLPTGI
jgi:hypothetical protein